MRYIQITWKDFLTDQDYWETIANEKNIALHIASPTDIDTEQRIKDRERLREIIKGHTPAVLGTP